MPLTSMTANLVGRPRRVSLNGRDYLVAPSVLIVSGVLEGSEGPLYYPPSELAAYPEGWNHTPIVVYHPTENNIPVSARSPQVLERQGVGFVFNSKYTVDILPGAPAPVPRLTAEAWLEVDALRRVDASFLAANRDYPP